MATLTASAIGNTNIKRVHTGDQTVAFDYRHAVNTITVTASSRFLLAQIPHGATIKDFYIHGAVGAAGELTAKIGLQIPEGSTSGSVTQTESALLGETTLSAGVALRPGGAAGVPKLPFKLSLSDEAIPRYAWVTAVNVAGWNSTSGSVVLRGWVTYYMD